MWLEVSSLAQPACPPLARLPSMSQGDLGGDVDKNHLMLHPGLLTKSRRWTRRSAPAGVGGRRREGWDGGVLQGGLECGPHVQECSLRNWPNIRERHIEWLAGLPPSFSLLPKRYSLLVVAEQLRPKPTQTGPVLRPQQCLEAPLSQSLLCVACGGPDRGGGVGRALLVCCGPSGLHGSQGFSFPATFACELYRREAFSKGLSSSHALGGGAAAGRPLVPRVCPGSVF